MYGYGCFISANGKQPSVGVVYPPSLKFFIDAGNSLSYSGSGTTVNDLIGNQNGTLTNGVGYSTANGGCFTLDGVNDYITFGTNTTIQPTTARTISLWVLVDSSVADGFHFFSDGDPAGSSRNGFAMLHNSGPGFRSVLMSASSYQIVTNQASVSKDVWYYVTTSWNGSTIKTYVNGVLINTITQTEIPTNGIYPTYIGRVATNTSYFKGKIGQCKIYNVQLSNADVLADYNEFKARYGY